MRGLWLVSVAHDELTKIRTLADAGVQLSQIRELLEADEETFAEAVKGIDRRLRGEIRWTLLSVIDRPSVPRSASERYQPRH